MNALPNQAAMQAEARKQAEIRDFVSLSQTQRRHAHEYRRWALEAEREGKLERYRRYRAECNRLWRNALWNLRFAKQRLHQ